MDKGEEEEIDDHRAKWKEQFKKRYDKLTEGIGTLRNIVRRNEESIKYNNPESFVTLRANWTLDAYSELRDHLQLFDVLNEKVFTLSETLRVIQRRLVVAEEELAQLEKERRLKEIP